jgi:hypothetical protein
MTSKYVNWPFVSEEISESCKDINLDVILDALDSGQADIASMIQHWESLQNTHTQQN